jgi:hypothetical protein
VISKDGSEIPVNSEGDSVVIIDEGTGIASNSSQMPLRLYPNPVTNEVVIETGKAHQEKDIAIRNVLGQKVIERNDVRQARIRIATKQLGNGVYFVTVASDEGKRTEKMVISR